MMGAQIKKHVSKHASICALSNAALGVHIVFAQSASKRDDG